MSLERTFGNSSFSSSRTWCFVYSASTFTPASYSGSLGRRGFEAADDVLQRLVLDGGLVQQVLPLFLLQRPAGGG